MFDGGESMKTDLRKKIETKAVNVVGRIMKRYVDYEMNNEIPGCMMILHQPKRPKRVNANAKN